MNSIYNTRRFLQISHLLFHFSIEQLFSFIVLGNKNSNMSSFKFLFGLYVTLKLKHANVFLMMILMLGSNGLYRVIKFHEAEKLLLFLGLLASSLEMFLTSENCFLALLGS